MEFKDIKTPQELYKYMKENIEYGFIGNKTGKLYKYDNPNFEEGCRSDWGLASKEVLLKNKYGHCFDQVELERSWFKENGYEFKTIFIWYEFNYDNPYQCHTYLVYKDNDKWNIFEHADGNNKGIYEFKSLEEAIQYQKKKHIEYTKSILTSFKTDDIEHIGIYEYNNPKYNCNMIEFIDNIINNGIKIGEK